jgi:hypothetical protein
MPYTGRCLVKVIRIFADLRMWHWQAAADQALPPVTTVKRARRSSGPAPARGSPDGQIIRIERISIRVTGSLPSQGGAVTGESAPSTRAWVLP